jgi:outer membrane receptor for ferrienterochelin and colicins
MGQLNLSNVDHIEVIEGPTSVVYGSNALAGVINIITGDYSQYNMSSRTSAYYETVGIYNFNTLFSKRFNNQVISLNAGRNFQSGWGPDKDSRYKIWKPKEQYLLNGGYTYKKNNLLVKYSTEFLDEQLRDLDSVSFDGKALDAYHYTTRWNNSLNFSNMYNADFVLNLQAGYSYYRKRKISYNNDLVTLNKVISNNPELNDTTIFNQASLRGFVSNMTGKRFEYQTGFDFSDEWTNSKRTNGLKEISDMAGFMSIIYRPINKISLQPGLRAIYNSKYHAPLVYSANIIYEPSNLKLRASFAKGFTSPSLKQLYLEFIDNNHHIFGNENLKPETANNLSFSVDYNYKRALYSFDASIASFYNSFTNAIQLAVDTSNTGWGTYFNIEGGHYVTKGVETKLNFHLFPRFTIGAGTSTTGRSHLDKKSQFSWSTDFVTSFVYHSPKYNYEIAAFYKYIGTYSDFKGIFNSEGIAAGGNLSDVSLSGVQQGTTQGYHNMDITVSKAVWRDRIIVAGGVKNLFDVTLVNATGSLDPHSNSSGFTTAGYGRTYYLKLVFQLDKY